MLNEQIHDIGSNKERLAECIKSILKRKRKAPCQVLLKMKLGLLTNFHFKTNHLQSGKLQI